MAKTICKLVGAVLLLVGIVGFISRDVGGTHLTNVHNAVHLVSGALALYFGFAGTLSGARMFAIVFGAVYLLLGVAGFFAGHEGTPTAGVPGPPSSHMMKVMEGNLELGSRDHAIHILVGLLFLVGGLLTKADVRRAVDDR